MRSVATIVVLACALALGANCTSDDDGSGNDGGTALADGGTSGNLNDGGVAITEDGGLAKLCGTDFKFGDPGPWPLTNTTYLTGQAVRGISFDESQNLWVATESALHLRRPGDADFRVFTSADGLHLSDNPIYYDAAHVPTSGTTGDRGAACGSGEPFACHGRGIASIVGGGCNEVFVGYYGSEPELDAEGRDDTDPGHHMGKIDRVRLNADGTIEVKRFDTVSNNHGRHFWHNRTVHRMVYDHFIHPHNLYAGMNHGVVRFMPDKYRDLAPEDLSNIDTKNYQEWMGDHVHTRVCFEAPCGATTEDESSPGQRMSTWLGIALSPEGDLWHAGRFGAGKILFAGKKLVNGTVVPGDGLLTQWYYAGGDRKPSFGDPYDGPDAPPPNNNRPVFPADDEGHPVNLSAVTVAPDGGVWFGSLGPRPSDETQFPTNTFTERLAQRSGNTWIYHSAASAGLGENSVRDLVALPDGRLAVAGPTTGVHIWNPATGTHSKLTLPSDTIHQMALDTMVSPPVLLISTAAGAAAIRELPAP